MKTYLTIILLILVSLQVNSQVNVIWENQLIGIWQVNSKECNKFWNDTYAFYENGDFAFTPSMGDGLRRVVNIMGKYQINGDSLTLNVHTIHEKVGGKIVRSRYTSESDSWMIVDAEIKEFNIVSKPESLQIKECDDDCIWLDKRQFFKVIDDPEDIY